MKVIFDCLNPFSLVVRGVLPSGVLYVLIDIVKMAAIGSITRNT